ncbi:thioredoxin domain-containing protein [Solitalea koreensis]|uniref:Thioredoxin-like n=1 Tax=Solitalea koreensis TaxID=543615 RepID=A0A521DN91_9SPHI|nr:hypothetical protein [Solitalea koreensis]SMO72400.1 hypothetical protein SAMN06265350_107118 [Solitalea koreensis]
MEQAIEEAQKTNRTLVAIVSKQGCASCESLPKDIVVHLDKQINSSNYLFYKIVTDFPENTWVNQWLYDYSFPITCIISPKGQLVTIHKNGSYKNFLELLKSIDQPKNSVYPYSSTQLKLKNKV